MSAREISQLRYIKFFCFVSQTSKVGSTLLSSKARKVSSLVQKWQSVKQQQEPVLDSSEDEEEENDPARQIEDWKKEHMERYWTILYESLDLKETDD